MKFKFIWLGLLICIGLIKCSVPTFIISPYDIHCTSVTQILDAERNIWYYRPLVDSLIIKDSLRDVRFHVKEAYAYDNRWVSELYFQYYLPWINIYEDNQRKMFGIKFDSMGLYDISDKFIGLNCKLDSAFYRIFSGITIVEGGNMDFSYFGCNIKSPLPDTIRFIVSGNPYIYMNLSTYRSFPEKERLSTLHMSDSLKNEWKIMGIIIFVKGDSIIFKSAQKHTGRKLFYESPQKM